MTNTNCLEGLACPNCGHRVRLFIEVRTLADVTDDGAETFGDMEWDASSYAECPECRYHGTLGKFRIPADHENETQPREE